MELNITLFYLLSFVFIRLITRCYSLSLIVIFCHSLSFVIIQCHSLSFVIIRCHSYHSLSLLIPLVITCYHSLSLVIPLVLTLCHSMYYSSTKEYGRHQISSIYVFGFVSVWVGVFLLLFSIFLVELFLFLNVTHAKIFLRYEIFAIVYFVTFSLYSTFHVVSIHQQKIWNRALQQDIFFVSSKITGAFSKLTFVLATVLRCWNPIETNIISSSASIIVL